MKPVGLLAAIIVTIVSTAQVLVGADTSGGTWSQWRGPGRDGVLVGGKLPERLDKEHLKQVWRVDLGPGYSGPIVSDKHVFVTETKDKKTEVVRALDRKTGEVAWKNEWPGSMSVPFFAKANGDWIRATPAFDGERIYVAGIRDLLVCMQADSGKELWRIDFVKKLDAKVPSFGCVSSPLVIGDHVYVQAGGGFNKIDKLTGAIVWRSLLDGGGMFGSAFSSPYLAKVNDREQLIVQTRTALAGVDPSDGKVQWTQKIPAFRGMNILTPTVIGNSVFTSSYGGRSLLLTASKDESEWKITEKWSNKAQGYMSSPVVIAGHIYLHLRNRRLTCIDIASGETKWTTTPFGQYWSMVTDGDKILALDEKGELLLIKANPEKFDLIDRRTVAENSWAHIAVSGQEIFIRALDHVAVYRFGDSLEK